MFITTEFSSELKIGHTATLTVGINHPDDPDERASIRMSNSACPRSGEVVVKAGGELGEQPNKRTSPTNTPWISKSSESFWFTSFPFGRPPPRATG